MTFSRIFLLSLGMTLTALSGCAEVKDQMGLSRRTPDEFAVMTRAPLEMPPSMTELPRPQPGAPRPQEVSPVLSAQTALLGQSASSSEAPSRAESSLLSKAGADATNPSIRSVVDREAAEGAGDSRPVAKKLLGMIKTTKDEPAQVVDAPAELQRLKTNRETGQPVTKGDTPAYDD